MRKNWDFQEATQLIKNYQEHEVKKFGWQRYARLLGRSEASVRAFYMRLKKAGYDNLDSFNNEFGVDAVGHVPPLDNYKTKGGCLPPHPKVTLKNKNFIASFKFEPLQMVMVKSYNLNYSGRIIRCILEYGNMPIYDIELWVNGEPRRREFYEDELEGI